MANLNSLIASNGDNFKPLVNGLQLGQDAALGRLSNPGFITPDQLTPFIVGNAVGATKQAIYQIAIKNTEQLASSNFSNSPANRDNTTTGLGEQAFGQRDLLTSELGTPIFDFFELGEVFYQTFESTYINSSVPSQSTQVNVINKKFNGIRLVTALVDVTRSVDLVETKTMGSQQGTIKEWMGTSEWNISVTAYILYENLSDRRMEYNVNDLYELAKLPDVNAPIPVTSYFLNLIGVNDVVCTSLNLRPVEGMSGIVQVNLSFLSDSKIQPKFNG